MADSQPKASTAVDTRVTILERDVTEIRTSLVGLSTDVKAGFDHVFKSLELMTHSNAEARAARPHPINWYAIFVSVAATATVLGSLAALAEWRIGVAMVPITDSLTQISRELITDENNYKDLSNKFIALDKSYAVTLEQLKEMKH